MQGHVHRSQQQMVAAAIRQVFAADDPAAAAAGAGGTGGSTAHDLVTPTTIGNYTTFNTRSRDHLPPAP